jgi:hypothetical protein
MHRILVDSAVLGAFSRYAIEGTASRRASLERERCLAERLLTKSPPAVK